MILSLKKGFDPPPVKKKIFEIIFPNLISKMCEDDFFGN